ncbi:MAG: CinA family protein [Alphaproteobacteria bacterium]|nr:MAG: CinA family protein [Alphaproteobacteria bacterium]
MNKSLQAAAEDLVARAAREKLTVITAESCTSGLLATVLSEAPGAGTILHGGFVTYTKEHKRVALGVPEQLLRAKSAVCREVACAMAQGALERSTADLAAAITGVAGPEPDEDGNPVGRVYIAAARRGGTVDCFEKNYGALGRDAVREAAIADAIAALKRLI